MSSFQELLDLLRNPADGFTPDATYADTLANAHETAIMGAAGDATVWTEEKMSLEAAIRERDSTISDLKARNYDLLTKLPSSPTVETSEPDSNDSSDDSDPDIDDLFN